MKRILLLAFLILLPCNTFAASAASVESQPNIVLIFADDLGYGDLGCYGLKTAKTPNLDHLATEGTRYTSFYAQQVCGPSRMALLTGRYPSRVQRGWWSMPPKEVTFAELLKKAGYTTVCIGKWDVSGRKAIVDRMPNAQGFDYYWGPLGANDKAEVEIYENNQSVGVEKDMAALTRIYTDRSIRWMKEHVESDKDKPFMLYLSHTMMHTVIDASPEFRDRTGNGLYADTLEEFDHECGRLLKAIDELKLRDNTMVIFTSDNGAWSNDQERQGALNERYREWSKGLKIAWGDSGPLREGKGSDYEGGVRVPCLIRWPGKVAEGTESDAIFATLDILPTFASLAGVDAPKDRIIDGVDQTDLLLGKSKTGNRKTYFYFSGKHGVREGKWKLLYENRWPKSHNLTYPKDKGANKVELYDIENDLGETTNLADKHPEVVERLLSLEFPKKQ
jgi:arylsulfatase A-like enzyme